MNDDLDEKTPRSDLGLKDDPEGSTQAQRSDHAAARAAAKTLHQSANEKVRHYGLRFARMQAAYDRWREARAWMRTPSAPQSRHGLDWLNFFMADVETGFGAFVAFYLAGLGWSKGSVGLALGFGQIAAVVSQIPSGALVDAVKWKRGLAAIGIMMVMSAALIYFLSPLLPLVFLAETLHGLASGLIAPSIAAISLGLVGRKAMSSRTGRNYRFNAAGNAVTAGSMGMIGSYVSPRMIFLAAFGLCLPALFALSRINPREIDYRKARNAAKEEKNDGSKLQSILGIARNRGLLLFTLSFVLFQLADASMLPLVAENLGTAKSASSLMTSGLIVAPQLVVVLLAPWVGYLSELRGRKPLLVLGYVIEALRAILLASIGSYAWLIIAQLLGGITSAIIGVLTVLIITDLTTGTGRFNLTRGAVMMFSSIAASASVAASGFVFQSVGNLATFGLLAAVAGLAAGMSWLFLPETKPETYLD